jgi:hypothetical protein
MGKVFGIGLSRTGTRTLSMALYLLGYKVCHYPDDLETFHKLMFSDFDIPQIDKYEAVTDVQVSRYFKQFDQQYPGSKFILTVRDKEGWLTSTKKHFTRIPRTDEHVQENYRKYLLRMSVYGSVRWHEQLFSDAYDEHVAKVCEYFKDRPDDLLLMNICNGDAWEILCPFLDKPIPEKSFPYKITNLKKWKREQRQ